MKNWKDSARIEYETSNSTLEEIAEKFNKTPQYVRLLAGKEKWAKSKKQNSTEIQQEIQQIKQEIIQNKKSEIEKLVDDEIQLRRRTIQELSRLAFVDIRNLFNDDYTLKSVDQLDDDTAAALAGVELVSTTKGTGDYAEPEWTKKIKTWDKRAALTELMKYLGMFEKDNQQKNGFNEWLKSLDE